MADGRLADAELKAIRARLGEDGPALPRDLADARRLLRALDAALADLAAAGGALHDLTSPQSGEANAAYLRGVEDERARCAALLRLAAGDWRRALPQAANRGQRQRGETVVVALEDAALALESPPAPAAARGGSQ